MAHGFVFFIDIVCIEGLYGKQWFHVAARLV